MGPPNLQRRSFAFVKYCYHYIDFLTFVPYINDIMIVCAKSNGRLFGQIEPCYILS